VKKMPVKRNTINLNVSGNFLCPTDADTGLPVTDAGFQGEDGAVWIHVNIPTDWQELSVRLQVQSSNGKCDVSGLPLAGAIDMPLRSLVTVPGRLTVTLTGTASNGVRRTAQCQSLFITSEDCLPDTIPQMYPLAFENLCNEVESGVVHTITGSGGAKVTKTDDTTYDINVTGVGGDMLQSNFVTGKGVSNVNIVDHAAYADKTGLADNATHADSSSSADIASSANNAAVGSPLEAAINARQQALSPGGGGGVDLLSGTTVKSLQTNGLTITSDNNCVTLGIDGALATTGAFSYFAQDTPPSGWLYADGRQVKITDYQSLYNVIGDKYGQGTISNITVSPTYLTDNNNPASDIVLQKYASGIQTVSYFASNGTVFDGDGFDITTAGSYTVYCKDSSGREAIQIANIPAYSAPFIINTYSDPLTSDWKLVVWEQVSGNQAAISLVKFDVGIQTTGYFAQAGLSLGTQTQEGYTFQDGTTMPSGNYTWYVKDASGHEAVQYFMVTAKPTLTMYLTLSTGSDSFKLPNMMGTLNAQLTPCIKS
jgi:hypothetical protein